MHTHWWGDLTVGEVGARLESYSIWDTRAINASSADQLSSQSYLPSLARTQIREARVWDYFQNRIHNPEDMVRLSMNIFKLCAIDANRDKQFQGSHQSPTVVFLPLVLAWFLPVTRARVGQGICSFLRTVDKSREA